MKTNLIERRQKMLKLKTAGLSLVKVVKDLSRQYDVSMRAIYLDWQNRKTWLPSLLGMRDPETFCLDLLSTHKEIHRLAMMEYFRADNSNAKIGALRLLRDLNNDFAEMIVLQDLSSRVEAVEAKAAGVV